MPRVRLSAVSRQDYALDLDAAFVAELERIAKELGTTPGRAIEVLTGDLHGVSVSAGAVVATADGYRQVMTRRSTDIR